jgi:cytochrome oxidase assembly protein ShyY1
MAVFLHFSYNFLVLTGPIGVSGAVFVMILTVLTSWQLQRRTKEKIVI